MQRYAYEQKIVLVETENVGNLVDKIIWPDLNSA
jgi:hypothetical protein